ncbi:thioesterase family protein [Bacillus testis]|uniref:thioesterase family protein n=1 Tax=Bacillus testis TaxID=1622072 RepID=UPI00067E9D6B|nr:thioesterase [Bacillus testis]
MKQGLRIGHSETIETVVTPEMFARFGGEIIHPAYSTVSMVYHMEWASRKIILPYLEPHEEGLGASVQIKHMGMSPVDSHITIKATVSQIRKNIVVTDLEVRNEKEMIGVGTVTQIILDKKEIKAKLAQTKGTVMD